MGGCRSSGSWEVGWLSLVFDGEYGFEVFVCFFEEVKLFYVIIGIFIDVILCLRWLVLIIFGVWGGFV